jgi:hypothetical protein
MIPLFGRSPAEILNEPEAAAELACERSLRVAAATITDAPSHEISATRVVGVLGLDDLSAFEALVARLAEEYEVEASVRVKGGSFSVRFSRPSHDR